MVFEGGPQVGKVLNQNSVYEFINIYQFVNFPNCNYDNDLKIKTIRMLHCNPIQCLKLTATLTKFY